MARIIDIVVAFFGSVPCLEREGCFHSEGVVQERDLVVDFGKKERTTTHHKRAW